MIRNVLAVIMLGALALTGWSLWRQLDQPVRSVRVEGDLSGAEQTAIRQAVSGHLDRGLLSLDLTRLSAGIHALSWPRSVQVRRVWPDALVIRVEKESLVAAWGAGGYLNSAGKVVQLAETEGLARDGAVPVLATTLSPPRRAMEVYQMLQSRVNSAGFSITRLEENALGEWLVTLDNGIDIALGNELLAQRLDRFLLASRGALAERVAEIARVDMRYDNGLAVGWNDVTIPAGAPEQQPELDYALR